MHKLGLYEEQLYELLMCRRNNQNNIIQETTEQENIHDNNILQETTKKKNLHENDIIDSIIKTLHGYVSITDYLPF